jgi:AcrR family transcriptional regulator
VSEHTDNPSAPPSASAPPRWQRRPEARPEEILDAAFDVFGEQGFARTRLEDVAQRAGVSKGTLYLYFDSKETLP